MARITSDKLGFKIKTVPRDKEGHFIMIKGLVYLEDVMIINTCKPNNRPPKYMRQNLIELKGEGDKSTIVIRNVNIPLSMMDRTIRQKNQQGWRKL